MPSLSLPRHCFFVASCLTALGWSQAGLAQDWSNAPREQTRQNRDHVLVGIGAGYAPAYQGSDDYRTLPIPAIDIAVGPFFANLRNGIGVNVINTDTVTVGGSVVMMPGYRRRDAPDGIGSLSFGAGGRMFASLKVGGVIATVGGTQGFVGNTRGVIADASVSYPIMISQRTMLIPTVGTSWADEKHNRRYFGISAQQSQASGLPQFASGKSFKDASALLTVSHRLTSRINLSASGGVTTLLGDVKDSPLVRHKTQPAGFLSLTYRLGS